MRLLVCMRRLVVCQVKVERLKEREAMNNRGVYLRQWNRLRENAVSWTMGLGMLLFLAAAPALRAQPPGGGFGGGGLGGGGFQNLPHVRGTVTAVKGSDITIQPEQGAVQNPEQNPGSGATTTVHCSDNTRMYKARQPIQPSDIHVGDMVVAAGDLDAKAHLLRAVFVMDIDAATVAKMQADMGKTWIAGKITAINMDALQLTIARIDHQSQVITVDETTSFKKDGQSITLHDLHVGDGVRGKGSMKDGVFVPEVLQVVDAAQRGKHQTPPMSPPGSAAGQPGSPAGQP